LEISRRKEGNSEGKQRRSSTRKERDEGESPLEENKKKKNRVPAIELGESLSGKRGEKKSFVYSKEGDWET